jgi:hypothetical protein
MLFRPGFCCNCGEKIERANWKLWTSRRFCELCETDFALQEYIPKAFAGLGFLITLIGIGSYFRGETNRPASGIAKLQERSVNVPPPQPRILNSNALTNSAPMPEAPVPAPLSLTGNQVSGAKNPVAGPPRQAANGKGSPDERYYFCGAATKKGTACMRRVKGNVRCYQHVGQPAILPPDQLRAER